MKPIYDDYTDVFHNFDNICGLLKRGGLKEIYNDGDCAVYHLVGEGSVIKISSSDVPPVQGEGDRLPSGGAKLKLEISPTVAVGSQIEKMIDESYHQMVKPVPKKVGMEG